MQVIILYVFVGIIALLSLFVTFKWLFKGNWLLGWMRGTLGWLVISSALLLIGFTVLLQTFDQVNKDHNVLYTIQNKNVAVDEWSINTGIIEKDIEGKSWQLIVHRLDFSPAVSWLFGDSYLIPRSVQGVFDTIEEQERAEFDPLNLSDFRAEIIDLLVQHNLPFISLQKVKGPMVPMVDGGIYLVVYRDGEVTVEAENTVAQQAWPF